MMIKYINSQAKEFNLLTKSVRIKETNLHEYEYDPEKEEKQFGEVLKKFNKKAYEIPMTLYFYGSPKTRKENLEKLHEVVSVDRIRNIPGRLYFEEYYLNCFITAEEINPDTEDESRSINEIKIYAPDPYWIKETEYNFVHETVNTDNCKKYSYKYPYKYRSSLAKNMIRNKHYSEVDFKMFVYGPCSNPEVVIGKNRYKFYITLEKNERIEMSTKERKIYKVFPDGSKENVFHCREKGTTFFKKIQAGEQHISFGDFVLGVTTFEERSIPKWN